MARVTWSSWRGSPDAPLHLLFVLHLLMVSWSHLGSWAGLSLFFQDAFFLITLLWATHSIHAASPVILALLINVMSILLDIVALAVLFPPSIPYQEFSAVMAIFNLVIRLFSTFVLYKVLGTRDELEVRPVPIITSPVTVTVGGGGNNAAPSGGSNNNGGGRRGIFSLTGRKKDATDGANVGGGGAGHAGGTTDADIPYSTSPDMGDPAPPPYP